jgi:hypothetical protein
MLAVMQDSLITLLTPAMNDLKAVQMGDRAATTDGDQGLFEQVLSSVINGVTKASSDAGGPARISASEFSRLEAILPALMETDMAGLIRELAADSNLASEKGGLTAVSTGDAAARCGESVNDPAIKNLLLGMLSRAILTTGGNGPQTTRADAANAPASEEPDMPASVFDEEGGAGSKVDSALDTKLATKDEGVLESLALLLFGALQRMVDGQQTPLPKATLQDGEFTVRDLQVAEVKPCSTLAAAVVMDDNQSSHTTTHTSQDGEPTQTLAHPQRVEKKTSVDEPRTESTNPLPDSLIVRSIELSTQIGPLSLENQSKKPSGPSEKEPLMTGDPLRKADAASVEIRPDSIPGPPLSTDKAEKFLEHIISKLKAMTEGATQNKGEEYSKTDIPPIMKAKAVTEGAPGDKGTQYSTATIPPVKSAEGEGTSISFVLKGAPTPLSQDQPAGVGPLVTDGSARDGRKTSDLSESLISMLTKTGPTVGGEREGSSSQANSEEKRQPRQEGQISPRADQPSLDRFPNQEKNAAVEHQAPVAAVERFEKIAEQIAAKSSSHDLTVKLDVGNNESVVVGLKDLGQTVAVEVKASHQGLINLLESQKDAIIKHLEGKDVKTNVLIDPNASGTPERHDRRESRRRMLMARHQDREVFGTFLDTFA